MSMKPAVLSLRCVAPMILAASCLWSSQAAAQGVMCAVVANRNVTAFERMVADKISAGWEVKGGIAFMDVGGWTVLMCSR